MKRLDDRYSFFYWSSYSEDIETILKYKPSMLYCMLGGNNGRDEWADDNEM